jgi:hypothetical protein
MEKIGFFSEQLAHGMARQGVTAKALADTLGCSYEHVRKMQLGKDFPSLTILRQLCEVFGWSERKLRRFVLIDRMRKQFGNCFWIVLGRNPQFETLYILWVFLTSEEKDYFIGCLRLLVAHKQLVKNGGCKVEYDLSH